MNDGMVVVGVLVGLGMRTGVSLQLRLPRCFYEIISNETSQLRSEERSLQDTAADSARGDEDVILKTAALTIRSGIVSIFPEVLRYITFHYITLLATCPGCI